MKKLVSFVLILSMLCSMLAVPVFAADTATAASYKQGDVLYEQDFSNYDVASAKPYGYAAGNGGALKNFEVVDGALRINSSNKDSADKDIGGRYGTRLELYAIPDDVLKYSIEMDLYIDAYHNTTASQGPALLIADNGITDASTSEKLSEFSMFWFRYTKKGTTGTYTYGDTSQNVVDQNKEGFCEPGTWYHLEIYIDRSDITNRWGTFRATNKTTGATYSAEGFGFNPLAHKAIVGLYSNGTDTKYDNIKVTYGDAYFGNVDASAEWGTNVLYEQDFASFDVAGAAPYGYAAGNGGALKNFEVVDGALRINSSNKDSADKDIGGRYGTRLELYAIPDDVLYYSIEMDLYIDAYHNTTASQGPALLIADNGITDASTSEKLSEFSMFWFRYTNKGTTGTYTYGDTSQNVVSQTEPGFCEPGTWYHLEIYIDRSDITNRWGTFRATNKTTGATYSAEGFGFNPLAHKAIVGLYSNGTDAKFDNIKVTYGDAYFGNSAPSGADEPAEPEAPLDLTSPEAPKVNDADILYSQDFTYYPALTETIYGYGGVSGALKTYEVENGILHFESMRTDANGVALGGRFGSRVKLYEIPDDINQFSISMDLYLDEYAGSSASYGPALLLADNGVTDSSTTETLSQFSMIWLRQQGVGTSGAYTYGDTSLNVVSMNEPGITIPECWYRIQVYVDRSNPLDPAGMFRITNLTTNEVFETDYFCYNVLSHNAIVGLYNNASNSYIDNIYVVKGNAFLQDLVPEAIVTEPPQTTTKAPETETEPIETSVSETETIAPETSVTDPVSPPEPAGGISPIVIVVVAVVLLGGCVACFFLIKDNKIKYIIIGVIAVALVVFVIIAATAGGKQTDDGTTPGGDVDNVTTTASGTVGGDTTPAETEPQYTLPEVPELQGEVINVLGWKERTWDEFGAEMQNGDLFNDAKYARNVQIEELYGVTFEVNEEVAGNSGATDNYLAFVSNSVNSGSREFDIIAGYSQTMCSLPARGLLWDMMDTEHLDFDHPWWAKSMVEEFTIEDKLFICSGDIAPSSLYQMYMVYFNKDIIAENHLENPYELVMDGKWTLDKMIEMSTGIYADLNGNGLKDYGDRFGFVTSHLHLDPFFYGVGSKIVEKDVNGDLILSPSLTGEKTIATIDKLQNILFDGNDGYLPSTNNGTDSKTYTAFAENQALFVSDSSEVAVSQFQKDDLEFGIVPTPKYDEEQEDYITLFRYYMSYYAIPIDAMDPDASSAMMQALAYYNYKEIVPAVFEQSLKLKYANADEDAVMYDIIRENQTYDIGRLFSKSIIGSEGQALFRVNVGNNNSRWISAVRSLQSRWVKGIAELQEACAG